MSDTKNMQELLMQYVVECDELFNKSNGNFFGIISNIEKNFYNFDLHILLKSFIKLVEKKNNDLNAVGRVKEMYSSNNPHYTKNIVILLTSLYYQGICLMPKSSYYYLRAMFKNCTTNTYFELASIGLNKNAVESFVTKEFTTNYIDPICGNYKNVESVAVGHKNIGLIITRDLIDKTKIVESTKLMSIDSL